MNNINGAGYFSDPSVCTHMISQHKPDRQHGKKPFYHTCEIIKWRIEDEIPWMIVRGKFCSKAAPKTSSINYKVTFSILLFQFGINKLHVIMHFYFTFFPCAFSKAPVIYQNNIIAVTVKITGILCP